MLSISSDCCYCLCFRSLLIAVIVYAFWSLLIAVIVYAFDLFWLLLLSMVSDLFWLLLLSMLSDLFWLLLLYMFSDCCYCLFLQIQSDLRVLKPFQDLFSALQQLQNQTTSNSSPVEMLGQFICGRNSMLFQVDTDTINRGTTSPMDSDMTTSTKGQGSSLSIIVVTHISSFCKY